MQLGEVVRVAAGRVSIINPRDSTAVDRPPRATAKRVVLAMSNALDCELFTRLLEQIELLRVSQTTAVWRQAVEACRQTRTDLLIVDPQIDDQIVPAIADLISSGCLQSAVVIDCRFREGLLRSTLPFPRISYLTRNVSHQHLLTELVRVVQDGVRVFDLACVDRVVHTGTGLKLSHRPDCPGVACLTSRECEVATLLALGHSVRECASALHVAASTIDNHKTRLMRKLRVKKVTQLTYIAIRDGLIVV